jgi:type VI protein secretion system component VasK
MNWLKRAWRGEERLWKVFWLYSLFAPLLAYLLLIVFPLQVYGTLLITYSYFFVGWTLFNCWVVVPLWRCADNTGWWLWTRLARINVLVIVVQICVFIWSGGFTDLSGQNRASATCGAILEDQAREQHLNAEKYRVQHHPEEMVCIRNVMNVLR